VPLCAPRGYATVSLRTLEGCFQFLGVIFRSPQFRGFTPNRYDRRDTPCTTGKIWPI